MIALQISPKIESLYGLGRQATKYKAFVWNFATFARLPFGQFVTEIHVSFSNISVEMFRYSRNSPQFSHVSAIGYGLLSVRSR